MTATIESAKLLIPLAVTLVAPFAIWFNRRDVNKREAMSFIAAAVAFLTICTFVPGVLKGNIYTYTLFTILPGITVSFVADGLGMIFALIATFLWGFATSYNVGYMRGLNEHAQTRYYFCFAVAIFGAVGVAFAANVFTLYLFYEVITVFTYPLVAHHQDAEGFAGARKYLVYLMGTSKLFLLPAMIMTYVLCGTLDMSLGNVLTACSPADVVAKHPNLVRLTTPCISGGLAKAALDAVPQLGCPRHGRGPRRVSALLQAVAVGQGGRLLREPDHPLRLRRADHRTSPRPGPCPRPIWPR
jgi:multicomponent Na+:H+ antiporter subunit D